MHRVFESSCSGYDQRRPLASRGSLTDSSNRTLSVSTSKNLSLTRSLSFSSTSRTTLISNDSAR
uniref:Uncharacterized protein n=1 Tax=Arundo donax TaxID=35708 RepID=A0A0A9ALW4_ARUDO